MASNYNGTVNGIDVQEVVALTAVPEGNQKVVKCYAFINKSDQNYIQVATKEHRLQTALELASSKKVEVEVEYNEEGGEKILTRVQLLDR